MKEYEEIDDEEDIEDAEYPWLINADGGQDFPKPKNGKRFTLEELQEFVGGFIEYVRLPLEAGGIPLVMVVNEQGKLRRLEMNYNASLLARELIVGDVLVTPPKFLPR